MAGELTQMKPLRPEQRERSDAPREDISTDPVRHPMAGRQVTTRRLRVSLSNSRLRRGRGLPGRTLEATLKWFAERLRQKYPHVTAVAVRSLIHQQMTQAATADSSQQTKHPGGRPPVSVQPAEVQEMRDRGVSWRTIGKALGISPATAIKLYRAGKGVSKPFENSRPEVQR